MEKLHLKKANRTLTIKGFELKGRPYVTISCYEYWENADPDFGEDEEDLAIYYLKHDDINKIIDKLNESKKFLNKKI